jgi:hypothetical protein
LIELAEWGRGVAAGLLSGIACGAILALVWFIFIIPEVVLHNAPLIEYPLPGGVGSFHQGMFVEPSTLIDFIVIIGPSYGIFVGLWLAYNQGAAKAPLSLREGFRYGTMFSLPLAIVTIFLVLIGSLVGLMINVASIVVVGVVMFGYLLSFFWNREYSF